LKFCYNPACLFAQTTGVKLEYLRQLIREVPDFPKPGIVFYDITTALKDPVGLHLALDAMCNLFVGEDVDYVVGIEARGFIFAAMVAYRLNCGFIPIRKPNKLPTKVKQVSYALEYGEQTLEIHEDAIKSGDKILIIDDLLATGGTACAAIEMLESFGAEISGLGFLIELKALRGREKMSHYKLLSVLKYS
jgi:adenine phosphoribosyltransferase